MGSMSMRDALAAFSGKRVFVTGQTGFKGTWLTFLLRELGADVMGYALAPDAGPSHFEMLNLGTKINHVVGDIRDARALTAALGAFRPEYVFHLAAQALVKKSYVDPVDTISTNVMGSVHLLDAVRQCNSVRSLVYVTSDKCYENVEWVWGYRENDRLGGHDPYSASKAAAEIVFSGYARSFFASRPDLGVATSRAGNVVGGGDWAADRIIPDCIRAIESNSAIQLRNPKATRPWQYVLEPVSGYLLLAYWLHKEPRKYSGSWNFGPSTAEVRTVHEVASAIMERFGRGRIEVGDSQPLHREAQLLQLNCDKAHQLLNWYPRWGVERTLEATADWYKCVLGGGEAETISRTQLSTYFPELL